MDSVTRTASDTTNPTPSACRSNSLSQSKTQSTSEPSRGRKTHRKDDAKRQATPCPPDGINHILRASSTSRSARILRSGSRRPIRETRESISPIRRVYDHAGRYDAFFNVDARPTRKDENFDRTRAPHMQYGGVDVSKTKPQRLPSRSRSTRRTLDDERSQRSKSVSKSHSTRSISTVSVLADFCSAKK